MLKPRPRKLLDQVWDALRVKHIPTVRKKLMSIGFAATVQELLGHKDVKTTMLYMPMLNRGGKGVKSPPHA